jgi:hypothetical protein
LAYLAPATTTNDVRVTSRRGVFRSTFTNGILAAQWLSNVLNENGVIEKNELIDKISDPNDPHRKYLAGDVLPLALPVRAIMLLWSRMTPSPARFSTTGSA